MGDIRPGDIELHTPLCRRGHDQVPEVRQAPCTARPEVIDCWYDSGSMPFAQWHYPFENKDMFEKTFPADFISEAVDQTRGWFYTLDSHFHRCCLTGRPSKTASCWATCRTRTASKMSKHLGNVVDPWYDAGQAGRGRGALVLLYG